MSWLQCIGLVANYGLEKWNSFKKLILTIECQSDVQTDSRHLRHETLSLAQHLQGFRPLFLPHVNNTQIGERRACLRVERDYLAEIALCLFEPVFVQSCLAGQKKSSRIGGSRIGHRLAVSRHSLRS